MAIPLGENFDLILFLIASLVTFVVIGLLFRSNLIRRLILSLFFINVSTILLILLIETQLDSLTSGTITVLLIAEQAIIVLTFGFIYKGRVIDPLNIVIKRTNQMAGGDLVTQLDLKGEGAGETEDMLKSTNILMDTFRGIVTDIKDSSDQLGQAAEELASGSEEVAATTEEVTSTIQTIAEGAAEQVRRLDEVSQILSEMVTVTEDSIRQIGLTSKITLDLAEQTNLVSLNAAIEAAKASEAEGFQVVADHVRQLSVESKSASVTVNQITQSISERMRESVDHIVTAVDRIASVAENTAASSEEAAAAAEQQSAALQEITQQAQRLSDLSTATERNIKEFKVN